MSVQRVAIFLILVFACCPPPRCRAQRDAAGPARKSFRPTISITGGIGYPLSRSGLTQYWGGGPCGTITFTIPVDRAIAFGIGLDGALLKFDAPGFSAAHPGIAVRAKDLGYLSAYLAWRYTPFSRYRFAPYIGANIGASRFTGATYREVVNGVRQTYYFIPGIARLTIGVLGGLDVVLARSITFALEAKMTYVHNDPNAGLGLLMSGGIRVAL